MNDVLFPRYLELLQFGLRECQHLNRMHGNFREIIFFCYAFSDSESVRFLLWKNWLKQYYFSFDKRKFHTEKQCWLLMLWCYELLEHAIKPQNIEHTIEFDVIITKYIFLSLNIEKSFMSLCVVRRFHESGE